MSSYKPIDTSKEDFRKYLERSGFLDAMTKALIECNSARPEDVIKFVVDYLGAPREVDLEELENLKAELRSARADIHRLNMEIAGLKGEELPTSVAGLDTTEARETSSQNGAAAAASNVAQTESPAPEAEETAVVAGVASLAINEQGKENESKAVDALTTEVQNVEKPEEKEKKAKANN